MRRPTPVTTTWSALLLCLTGTVAFASWGDRIQGLPLIEFFPTRIVGETFSTFGITQDVRGRIYFGGEKLRIYDGETWQSFSLPGNDPIFTLRFGGGGQLWVGGGVEIGYFTEASTGDFAYISLRDYLPPTEREPGIVWGCGEAAGRVYFICTSKVLCWDGTRITATAYPTKTRLFPVWLDGELWFTHQETGLYRVTEKGPVREYPASALPPSAPFFLFRAKDGELRQISNEGIRAVGRPDAPLNASAFTRFGEEGRITGIAAAPEGNYYVATQNSGMAVLSIQGELLRTIGAEEGLPGNRLGAIFVDREGGIWSATTSGIIRLELPGAAGVFNEQSGLNRGRVDQVVPHGSALVLKTHSGIFQMQPGPGIQTSFTPLPLLSASYETVLPYADGLLLAKFGGIDFYDGHGLQSILTQRSKTFQGLILSRRDPQWAYFFQMKDLHRLRRSTTGEWQDELLASLPDYPDSIWESPGGDLWLDCRSDGPFCYAADTGKLTRLGDGLPAGTNVHNYSLTGHRDSIYYYRNGACYRVMIGTRQRTLLGRVPQAATVRAITPSPHGDRLYVTFERQGGDKLPSYGVGYFPVPADQTLAQWHELQIGKLATIGATSPLFALSEDGADTLWICGSEGAIRLRPDEIPVWRRPATPYLHLPGLPSTSGPPGFPFNGHRVQFKVSTPEISGRKDLLFQTRLGDERAPWSEARPRSSFEFTNLREGDYIFAVRSVNPAGLPSEPVSFSFRIRPPWYRTVWAYTGYGTLLSLGVFGFIRVRERRSRERTRELERVVAERTTELVKANAAKDEFLAGISHEIRNPMNGVVGLASAIDTSRLDETSKERFAYLRHCAAHLSSLLEDVLDFSKLQVGAVSLEPQPFDLPLLVQSIAAITSMESAQIGIPVEIAVSPVVPDHLVGDASRIRQILLNLVINALKYSRRGKVCLTVWSRQTVPDSCELTFAVSDEGPGISPEEQARLFTRFERGQAARQQRVAGAGLGLALCRTLAERMGGLLTVESELGRGSTFSLLVTLPVAADFTPVPRPVIPTQLPPVFRALVVDDEDYNRVVLGAMLRELGYASVTAVDGDTALAAARAQEFDAIFLDFELPGKNGPEIARELRALPGLPADLPIVATTAYSTPEKRALCYAAGMNGFVSKPVSLEKIRSALAAATSLGRPTAPLHIPHATESADPLAALRYIASRKDRPLAEEVALYLRELEAENAALETALRQRAPAAAARSTHRLTGRLAFVHADAAERCIREIELAAVSELWEQTETGWRRYCETLEPLRDRLRSTAD